MLEKVALVESRIRDRSSMGQVGAHDTRQNKRSHWRRLRGFAGAPVTPPSRRLGDVLCRQREPICLGYVLFLDACN